MKQLFITCVAVWFCCGQIQAADTVRVHNTVLPVMTDREYNVVAEFCIENPDAKEITVDEVKVSLGGSLGKQALRNVSLVYTGTMSALYSKTTSYVIKDAFYRMGASQRIYCDPGYAILKHSVKPSSDGAAELKAGQKLVKGKNWFYVSVSVDGKRIEDLTETFTLDITDIKINGKASVLVQEGPSLHRLGTALRDHRGP